MTILPETRYLFELAKALRDADRMGAEKDEPEGTRYIQISDTLARQIEQELVLCADAINQIVQRTVTVADSESVRRFLFKP
jgi:hypothetical protein